MDQNIQDKMISIFDGEQFSRREAFQWLLKNSCNGKLFYTIHHMAGIWKWHSSKVKRFLTGIQSASLIKKNVISGRLCITILNFDEPDTQNYAVINDPNRNRTDNRPAQSYVHTELAEITNPESIRDQTEKPEKDRMNRNQTDNRPAQSLGHTELAETADPISTRDQTDNFWQEEKKKKRTKKRKKEEFIKEKNIPYGDTKKENAKDFSKNLSGFSEKNFTAHQRVDCKADDAVRQENRRPAGLTQGLQIHSSPASADSNSNDSAKRSTQHQILQFELVEVSDVEYWVDEVLQVEVNLSWELDKFKNYWRSTHKKPPKDAVAAFKNWLYRGLEFNNQQMENKNDKHKFNRNKNDNRTDFQRFLAAGARVLAQYGGDRLDGDGTG